jgi:hypothetical protein
MDRDLVASIPVTRRTLVTSDGRHLTPYAVHHVVPQQCADTRQFRPQGGHLTHRFCIRMVDEHILETYSGFWVGSRPRAGVRVDFSRGRCVIHLWCGSCRLLTTPPSGRSSVVGICICCRALRARALLHLGRLGRGGLLVSCWRGLRAGGRSPSPLLAAIVDLLGQHLIYRRVVRVAEQAQLGNGSSSRGGWRLPAGNCDFDGL